MCGILGVAQFKNKTIKRETFDRALDSLSHRGPDSFGVFAKAGVFLGNRRLAIIDLSPGGYQPMALKCKKTKSQLQLVFNGEIYNFQELRTILENLGHVFLTHSDTETILHAFEEWGTASFEKLRGMFALAIWDEQNQKLFLARDRFGIKPLYYWRDNHSFVFGSEIRAIKALAGKQFEVRQGALYEFLNKGYICQPQTFYEGVQMLEAGSFMEVSENGVHQERFFDLASYYYQDKLSLGFEEAVSQLRNVLQDSARHHMLSDVPIGLFLSGGIDSSSLLVSLREQGFENLLTVSAVFPETVYDESDNIHSLVKAFQTNHCDVPVTGQDFLIFLDRIFEYMDQPSSDGVNTFFVSLAAKQAGLKVVLSGLGGDEIFYGYPSFRRIPKIKKLQPYLNVFQKLGGFEILNKINPFNRFSPKLNFVSSRPGIYEYWDLYRTLFTPYQIGLLAPCFTCANENEISGFDEANGTAAQAISYYELTRYMQSQLLRDSDVFSMAHSIELRVPFVDDFVMKFGASLPDSYKFFQGETKRILREVIRPKVPYQILRSPKKGFVLPIEKWMKNEAKSIIQDELLKTQIYNGQSVARLWDLFLAGKIHWSRIWSLFVLNRFLKNS
jgi:asparagine synthase (glutamine-hydrolysing)